MPDLSWHPLSRRSLIRGSLSSLVGVAVLAACGGGGGGAAPATAPTTAPAANAPAATTAPAANAPAAAPTTAPAAAAATTAPSAGGKVTELNMAFTWEAAFQPTQEQFNADFMKRHPDIKIKDVYNTWGDHNKIVPTWAAANSLPDVIYVHGAFIQPWARLGLFKPLDPYLDRDKSFNLDDFFPVALQLYIRDGKHYAIPYDHGPIILAYNSDLLDAAGVKPPDETTTMDQLADMARKLNKPGQAWGMSRLLSAGNENFIARIGPWGGQVMDDNETKTMLNTPQAATALDFWANLQLKDKVAPSPADDQAIQGGAWLAGKVALYPSASWDTPTYAKFAKFKWDVAPWPKGPQGQRTGSFGSGFGITRDSKSPDPSWTYLSEYLSKDGEEFMWGKTGRGSPSRKSAYQSFLDSPVAPKHAKFFEDAESTYAEVGHPYKNANSSQVLDILNREMDLVVRGTKSPKDALQTMQQDADPVLAAGTG